MNRDKARVAVYAMGGFYLLYLAWQMYGELSTAGSEKPLMIGFMIFFTIIGAGLAGWGCTAAGRQPETGWRHRSRKKRLRIRKTNLTKINWNNM